MILQLDGPAIAEISVEIGYGIIYLLLMIFILRKYKITKQKLALYFGIAFLCLSLSGLYGGLASLFEEMGFGTIPIIGSKILEIYSSLALVSLFFFLIGLLRLK